MDSQEFCLKWDTFQETVTSLFRSLRDSDELVDAVLCCEGERLRAHRLVLAASSPYFRHVLKDLPAHQTPVIFLKDTSAWDLRAVVEFMYCGRVNVAQTRLASFIKTAESLQIRGLTEHGGSSPAPAQASPGRRRGRPPLATHSESPAATPPSKRRRAAGGDAAPLEPAEPGRSPAGGAGSPPAASPAGGGGLSSPAAAADSVDQKPPLPGGAAPGPAGLYAAAGGGPDECTVKVEVEDTEDSSSLGAGLDHMAGVEPGFAETYGDGLAGLDFGGASAPNPNITMVAGRVPMPPPTDADNSLQRECRCELCGKKFGHPVSLTQHMKVHDGSTTCPVCGKVANRVSDLRIHLRNKHQLTKEQVVRMVPLNSGSRLPAPESVMELAPEALGVLSAQLSSFRSEGR